MGFYVKPDLCNCPICPNQECQQAKETIIKEISAKDLQLTTALFFGGKVIEKTENTLTVEEKEERIIFTVGENVTMYKVISQSEDLSKSEEELDIKKLTLEKGTITFEDINIGDLVSGRINTHLDYFDASFLIITPL